MNKELYNVCIMGIGFMLVFSAFQTFEIISKAFLLSIQQDNKEFIGDAYLSLFVIYIVFAMANWLAPSFIAVTGPRVAIVVGSFSVTLFMLSHFFLTTWLLYVISVLLGIGGAILWTGQGVFLVRCSNEQTISRNTGIFWTMYQCSLFMGNAFVYVQLHDKKSIDQATRLTIIGVLTGFVVLGNIAFLTFRYVPNVHETLAPKKPLRAAWLAFKAAISLLVTCDMILLCPVFMYAGILETFALCVYHAAIGFTTKLAKTPKENIALAGICLGVGEIIGGFIFGLLAPKVGGTFIIDPFMVSSFLGHILAFIFIWLNLPNNSPLHETDDISVFNPPRLWLVLLCAAVLGLGDAYLHIQLYTILGTFYNQQSAEAFALLTFIEQITAAGAFFYSFYIGLMWQLLILLCCNVLAAIFFSLIKWRHRRPAHILQTEL